MKRKAKRKPAQSKGQVPMASDPADALATAAARALGLPIDPAWHAAVVFNLRLIMDHAALVDDFALPDESEPAPVFHA